MFSISAPAATADWEEAHKLFLEGEYAECIRTAREAMEERFYRQEWPLLLAETLMTVGEYPESLEVVSNAMRRFRQSLELRLLAYDVLRQNGRTDEARSVLIDLSRIAMYRRGIENDAEELISVGRSALLLGADARLVLENFYNQAKKVDPTYREAFLAIGELALEKSDYDLAAKTFKEGLETYSSDSEILFGLARAYAPSDRVAMVQSLDAALSHNPKHIPSLLLQADHLIDAEEYNDAESVLDQVLAVNAFHPEAWAYRASIAHILNRPDQEEEARNNALRFWKTNPTVNHIIGRKLSQKYRFQEGSEYQRRALQSDAGYLPAKIQLAQDLLRLGEEEEGWSLAEQVHKADGYDVLAYNLVTLKETIARFRTLTNDAFKVRMDPHEAAVYGGRVMDLLQKAKESLCSKYELELDRPTWVEIFPEQKDFAVRTFGMPGGEGYLGVCFGHVITANSPASQTANPANWEAVLWHEFCHVVTLGLTKNKMPRWLSEGISVYEELKANPAWGQAMNPQYREMILKGELTPVGELSGAFLAPKSGMHLQFAYFESALVVEFLVERFGLDSLKRILADLGEGVAINAAIEAHTAPMNEIESGFEAFARRRAEELGPGLEWTRPNETDLSADAAKSLRSFPKNFWVLNSAAQQFIAESQWEEAKAPLRMLIENYPEQTGTESAYAQLALAHRKLGETEEERQVLAKWAAVDAAAVDAYTRLMDLDSARSEWSGVRANALRYLAVNPLIAAPHRHLARAAEELGHQQEAIDAYQTLLRFDPADLAEIHFRVAKLLDEQGGPEAKLHVLQALEEAPRFREAHRLLLKLAGSLDPDRKSAVKSVPKAEAPTFE